MIKWKRFTEEQIIAVLREHDAGVKAGVLARKHRVSEATLYNWKAKYACSCVGADRFIACLLVRMTG